MSLKRKLEDSLGNLEDKYDELNKKSELAEKRFVDKHGDQFDQMREKRELANQRFQERLANIGAWFTRIGDGFAERRARSKVKRSERH